MHAGERITVEEKVADFELQLNLCIRREKILLLVKIPKHIFKPKHEKTVQSSVLYTLESKDLRPTMETWL